MTVHVISRLGNGLVASLVASHVTHSSVRLWASAIPAGSVREGDLIVIDLPGLPPDVACESIKSSGRGASNQRIRLASPTNSPRASWSSKARSR